VAQTKYIILKNEDAVKYLTPEQKQQLIAILGAVNAGRMRDRKSIGDLFFALNMKDQFAPQAMDAYIAAIQQEGSYETNKNVQAALDTAVEVRQTAAMNVTPHLPD
jgi:hypothetical protein